MQDIANAVGLLKGSLYYHIAGKEELLFDRTELNQVWKLRRVLLALEPGAAIELLIDRLKTFKSNDEFLAEVAKQPAAL